MKKLLVVTLLLLLQLPLDCYASETFQQGNLLFTKLEQDDSCVSVAYVREIYRRATPISLRIPAEVINDRVRYKVTEVAAEGFARCMDISSIIIDEGVEKIGDEAFYGCCMLSSISLPSTIEEIGEGILGNCQKLSSINVAENNKKYNSMDGCNAIILTDSKELVVGCNFSTIPSHVRKISSYAFYCCMGLQKLDIPEGVEEIKWRAFWGCAKLGDLHLPLTLTTLAGEAFNGCSSLKSVYIPKNVNDIMYNPFTYCSGLDRIEVDKENKEYNSHGNSNAIIETATNRLVTGCCNTVIPRTCQKIEMMTFCGTLRLTSMYIPASVKEICDGAFMDNPCLVALDVDKNNKFYDSRDNCNCVMRTKDSTVVLGCASSSIPSTATSIGAYSFCGVNTPRIVSLPINVKRIDHNAFMNCNTIEELILSSSVKNIGKQAFSCCRSLRSVTLGDGTSKIGGLNFMDCTNLSYIYIPDGISEIEERAFRGCSKLYGISIPRSVKSIAVDAFDGCPVRENVWKQYGGRKGCQELSE